MDKAEFRKLSKLIEPCLTPEELDEYIINNFGIALPWDIVDEESTSSPLKFIWDIYLHLLTGKGPNRHILACSRNSAKTLDSSILQFFSMLHFRRDGVHIAATLNQSAQAVTYIDKFIDSSPLLAPYQVSNNTKLKEFVNLPPNDFSIRNSARLQVVTATKKGANAPRASCLEGKSEVVILRGDGSVGSNGSKNSYATISGIYNRLKKGEEVYVSSINPETGVSEYKRVLGAKRSLNTSRVKITTERGKVINSTPCHWYATGYQNGNIWYTKASDMAVGHDILTKTAGAGASTYKEKLQDTNFVHEVGDLSFDSSLISFNDFIDGSMLGDGCIYLRDKKSDGSEKKYKGNAYFCMKPRECRHCQVPKYLPLNVKVCNDEECRFKEYCNTVVFDKIASMEYYEEDPASRNRWVYDITVEDNHNFFANQVLVHNCLTFDETDLTPPEILAEAAFISDPSIVHKPDGTHEKRSSVFIYLSSRKSNDGPIQDLIDEAEAPARKGKKKPKLHKWSVVDWMNKCPDEQHLPEKGTFGAYINTDTLETHWSKEAYDSFVPEATKSKYKEYTAFEGCKTCPAWIACLGRSVKQRGNSFMLRNYEFTGDLLDTVKDPSAIIAQALNWKPETGGIVFRNFSYDRHVKDPIDFYEWVTNGLSYNPNNHGEEELLRIQASGTPKELASITPSKEDIYWAMIETGWNVGAGVDWGFSPDPAICDVVGYHKQSGRAAVLHIESANFNANHVWAEYVSKNIHTRFPFDFVAPDQADPSSNTYFAKHKVKSLGPKDKPPRIITGVSFIRGLLWNPQKNVSSFAILDDSQTENGNDMMIQAMLHWSHASDALGRYIPDKFADDKWTHTLDALRYFLHPYSKAKSINASAIQFTKTDTNRELIAGAVANNQEAIEKIKEKSEMMNQFKEHMSTEHGISDVFSKPVDTEDPKKKSKRSSGVKFSIG